MPLDFLLDRFDELPATLALAGQLPPAGGRRALGGLPGSSVAVLIATLARRLPQRQFGSGTGIEAFLDEIVGLRLSVECFACDFQDRLVGQDRQIGAGDLGDESELRTASRLLGAEIPFERGMIQAAQSLGMRPVSILHKIELPLAATTILAGIKTSAVINVGTATIAAFIGAGGYGERIVAGLALNDYTMLLAGAMFADGARRPAASSSIRR